MAGLLRQCAMNSRHGGLSNRRLPALRALNWLSDRRLPRLPLCRLELLLL